ncbi:HAMP domain-containing sensor histidine kinase [Peptoniphilus harei]|uniref:HAMP domain-containing sensor histidine kinase n=1 Tax=Peptoniphilus harei TaxID=54005 RepID=UPI00254EC474|nr:HAMP domain-containing sensor histidine kinase [Peptoniphilus harei]MDK7355580.1 HAMP domain-containing sensor histidine kinase [Peptoniphilus harei]MDK7371214.1 HAMP domain-containing sensor histidine kinase [Peptoniphilus harei]
MSKNKQITFNKFLFISILSIVLIVYVYNILTSSILEAVGNKIFSNIAYKYSADYIFNEDISKNENKIKKLDGWILILNNDLSLSYVSDNNVPKDYSFDDIVNLNKGTFKYKGRTYFASMKNIEKNGINKYGVVILPTKYITNRVFVTPSMQDSGLFLLFLTLKVILFILGTFIVVLIFSKILHKKLYNPLSELEKGFKKLKEEDYSFSLRKQEYNNISEFVFIQNEFNSTVKSLREFQKERLENDKKRIQLFIDIRHDLKTPITVIKGFSEAIINGKIPIKSSKKYLESINKNASNIDTLLNELSEIIEYEDYSYNLNLEKIDFCEFTRKAIIDFLPIFEQNDMNVIINIPDEKLYVKIDQNIFSRVFKNLMKNIIDHNEKHITVYFSIENCFKKVKLIIGDSGNKINEKLAKNIFEPFVTNDTSRNTSNKNRGLGLSIAKKIVEKHNGQIFLNQNNTELYNKSFIIELNKLN